ncbi:T9SS type A sorting domain-containing protein [Pseudoflavitalea sp. X16]|uniref:T9SS type A sorting domain-containing protein n=1 Tax=Paraflavitalea devenefica TaxID=2716334 RepID=UPI0014201192|nr:T9SS type A sorting domain-containing protein [Paraflavitalea devenefica]NII28032.1 T9SS type A sorting domain-containing protein [Paraflavitalea devenefica]
MYPLLRKMLWGCLVLLIKTAAAQCPPATPLQIDGVLTTDSRCQSSGTAQVQASGGAAPYTYSIIAGPVTAPPQSGDKFEALANGTYTLQVTDNCNNTVTRNFTIGGTYTTPNTSETLIPPSCQGTADGSMTIQVTGGRAPFTYSLIAPSPVIVTNQAGNVFSNLPAGVYTYRVQDSCGNFQTRTVTLLENTNNTFNITAIKLQWVACDSFYYAYRITSPASASFNAPFRAELRLPNGIVITHTFPVPTAIMNDTFWFRYKHTPLVNPWLTLTVFNACGTSKSVSTYMSPDMTITRLPAGGCSSQYNYTFDLGRDNNPTYPLPIPVHCSTITYTLVNPTGVVVASQVNNSTFSGFPAGNGYKVIREDCCAKDSLIFNWQEIPRLTLDYSLEPSCKEGTAFAQILNSSKVPGTLIVASGPAAITFADGSVHNYIYPDTLHNLFGSADIISLGYLTAGTYTLYYADACGQKDTVDMVISPSMVKQVTFDANLVKGCVNDNKIIYNGTGNVADFDYITINGSITATQLVTQTDFKDSAVNLQPGLYQVDYNYGGSPANYLLQGMADFGCDVISRNIHIPVYQQPWLQPQTAVSHCGTDRIVSLQPDSNRGVLPFQYQITAGPGAAPAQSNPVFNNLPKGMYTIQMTDACGNSYSNNIAIDTMINTGLSLTYECQFDYVLGDVAYNRFYTPTWQYPNSTVSSNPLLYISPITKFDTGYYKLTITSNINGCVTTRDTTIRVDLCILLAERPTGNRPGSSAGSNEGKLWVYPVPAPRQAPVRVQYARAAKHARLQVIDLQGRTVLQQNVDYKSTQTSLNLGKLPAGTYLLVYINKDQREIAKMVLQ